MLNNLHLISCDISHRARSVEKGSEVLVQTWLMASQTCFLVFTAGVRECHISLLH